MHPYTIDPATIRAWVDQHREHFLSDLASVISIRSVSEQGSHPHIFGEGCARVLTHMLSLAEGKGLAATNHEYYCGTALLPGASDSEIGLFSHLDVVPEGEGWNFDPFGATIHDGLMIGRGVTDNKGAAVMALYALAYLKEVGHPLRHSIRVFFGCSEETGMADIEYYTKNYKAPAFSLIPDCGFPVCNAEKGIAQWNLTTDITGSKLLDFVAGDASNMVPTRAKALLDIPAVAITARLAELGEELEVEAVGEQTWVGAKGIGAHAAHPQHSLNAAQRLAAVLVKTNLLDDKGARALSFIAEKLSGFYGEAFGIAIEDAVSGKLTHIGGLTFVREGKLTQNINIRYPVTADYAVITRGIVETCRQCGFSAEEESHSQPSHVSADTPAVDLLLTICRDLLGYEDPKPYSMGGGTYARHLPYAVGFGPNIDDKPSPFGTDRGREHQPDECVEVEDLLRAVVVYITAIVELDRLLDVE